MNDLQVVLEDGLDISSLPGTLKEDFNQLVQLEGWYRVTGLIMEDVDLEDLSPGRALSCGFCDSKAATERISKILVDKKMMYRLSKVIE